MIAGWCTNFSFLINQTYMLLLQRVHQKLKKFQLYAGIIFVYKDLMPVIVHHFHTMYYILFSFSLYGYSVWKNSNKVRNISCCIGTLTTIKNGPLPVIKKGTSIPVRKKKTVRTSSSLVYAQPLMIFITTAVLPRHHS